MAKNKFHEDVSLSGRNMKILFISQLYPEEIAPELISQSKIGLDWAAHNLSTAIISGLEANGVTYSVLNVPMMGSFPPFSKSPFVPGCKSGKLDSVAYLNVTYLKRIDAKRRVSEKVREWCKTESGDKCILFYNYQYLDILPDMKEEFPELKSVLLLTDLPEYTRPHHTIYTRLNELVSPVTNVKKSSSFDYLDGYVFLAEKMCDRMPAKGKPYMLMEGIYNDECINASADKDCQKVIMYTGNLSARYGIGRLLDAFALIEDPDYRLWIRGNGDMEGEVHERARHDSRIVYMERMSRHELTLLQKKATVLVNPVSPSEEFTSYFFPSKTLEYMASGTPTIMYHLGCMPNDYDGYIYYCDEDSVSGLASKIMEVCSQPRDVLNAFGKNAADFIIENKSPKNQISKVVNFINSLSLNAK